VSDHARQVRFMVKKVHLGIKKVRFMVKKVLFFEQEAILPVRCMSRIKKRSCPSGASSGSRTVFYFSL
jgi:hypothetical protein